MTSALAKKVAFRAEHTGSAGQDRAQRLAQATATAHEQTKTIVSALMNRSLVKLAADTTIGVAAYAQLLSTTITTVLAAGNLDITFSFAGTKTTNNGTISFRVVVDGVVLKGMKASIVATYAFPASMIARVAVSQGTHTVRVDWLTDTASVQVNPVTTVENHAHLLVQEAL